MPEDTPVEPASPPAASPPVASPVPPAPVRFSRASLAIAAVALLVAAGLPLVRPDALVTAWLVHGLPRVVAVLAPLDRASPAPWTDVLELVALGLVVGPAALHATRLVRRRESAREAAVRLGSRLLALVAAVYLLGVPAGLYDVGRRPIEERLALDPSRVGPSDLVDAALALNAPLVEARRALGDPPRLLFVTRAGDWHARGSSPDLPIDPAAVDAAARQAARDAVRTLEGRDWDVFVDPRAPVPDRLLHLYGVAGRTLPLFGEVCVSPYLSTVEYPVILAHEYAHATGVIREREADFYAFVGASRSPCALLRFSSLAVMRSRLTEAAKARGVEDAWDRVRAPLPADLLAELDVLSDLYQRSAFAPGGSVELTESASGEPEVASVTAGDPPGSAPVAAYRAVAATAGLPPDYDSCLPLVALWLARR